MEKANSGTKPKLRFGGYTGDWQEKELNEVLTFINGRAYKQEELLTTGKYPVLRVGNFFTNENWYYSDMELEEHKYCDRNDLLYAWSASFGPRIWEGDKVIYHYHIWKVLCSSDMSKDFAFHLLDWATARMKTRTNGFALQHITKGTIEAWKSKIPTLPEQQKIAAFLGAVDRKIQQLRRKQALLEQYKKGVVQQLFAQELRFKREDGGEFPEWEEKTLGEVIIRNATGLNPRKNFKLGTGENYYVTIKNIRNGSLDFSSCEKIDDEAMALIRNRSDLRRGDLIMASIGNVGDAFLLEEEPVNWNINESVFALRPSKEVVPRYLFYVLTSDASKAYLESNSTGSSFKSIKLTELRQLPIPLPSLEEQSHIAGFLMALDAKVAGVAQAVAAARKWKRGILQQMFV